MIKNAQKINKATINSSPIVPRQTLQARRLTAIEIAEGALLADIAVIFQVLIRYLPVGGVFLQLLVPIVFAILVLRRGLYVACMSLCVALFMICIVIGPGGLPFFLLEIGAGLFLGVMMRYQFGPLVIFVSGVFGGGLALWSVLLIYSFLAGGPAAIILGMHRSYASLTPVLNSIFAFIHLGSWWQSTAFPVFNRFVQWALNNWLLLFWLLCCVICIPLVLAVYVFTNFSLRLLGYQVRPFPGNRLEGWLNWLARRLLKFIPKKIVARSPFLHNLQRELRRLNIARARRQRLAEEEKHSV